MSGARRGQASTATVLMLLGVALAGCLAGEGAPAAPEPSGSSSRAVFGNATGDVGDILGLVTNDEDWPLASAHVGILSLGLLAVTDEAGRFELLNVPAGTHTVVADRLGYASVGQRVTLAAGQSLTVRVVLERIHLEDPFHQVFQQNVLHHFGQTYVTWAINLTGLSPGCSGCQWMIESDRSPEYKLVEIVGRHSVPKPTGSDQEYFWSFRNCYSGSGCGPIVMEGYYAMPSWAVANKTTAEPGTARSAGIGDANVFWNQLLCEFNWFCFEERREVYITLFHHMGVPETFTARPDA